MPVNSNMTCFISVISLLWDKFLLLNKLIMADCEQCISAMESGVSQHNMHNYALNMWSILPPCWFRMRIWSTSRTSAGTARGWTMRNQDRGSNDFLAITPLLPLQNKNIKVRDFGEVSSGVFESDKYDIFGTKMYSYDSEL